MSEGARSGLGFGSRGAVPSLLLATLAVVCTPAAPAAAEAGATALVGLWHGKILYEPAEIELSATLEIGAAAGGRLVGTVDIPSQDIRLLPLSAIEARDGRFEVTFRWPSEMRGPDAPYHFSGSVEAGEKLTGTFIEGDRREPFHLRYVGPPGTPRPEVDAPPLHDLSDDLGELRRAFNEDGERVRLVLLLSPT